MPMDDRRGKGFNERRKEKQRKVRGSKDGEREEKGKGRREGRLK